MSPIQTRARARKENKPPKNKPSIASRRQTSASASDFLSPRLRRRKLAGMSILKRRETVFVVEQAGRILHAQGTRVRVLADSTAARANVDADADVDVQNAAAPPGVGQAQSSAARTAGKHRRKAMVAATSYAAGHGAHRNMWSPVEPAVDHAKENLPVAPKETANVNPAAGGPGLTATLTPRVHWARSFEVFTVSPTRSSVQESVEEVDLSNMKTPFANPTAPSESTRLPIPQSSLVPHLPTPKSILVHRDPPPPPPAASPDPPAPLAVDDDERDVYRRGRANRAYVQVPPPGVTVRPRSRSRSRSYSFSQQEIVPVSPSDDREDISQASSVADAASMGYSDPTPVSAPAQALSSVQSQPTCSSCGAAILAGIGAVPVSRPGMHERKALVPRPTPHPRKAQDALRSARAGSFSNPEVGDTDSGNYRSARLMLAAASVPDSDSNAAANSKRGPRRGCAAWALGWFDYLLLRFAVVYVPFMMLMYARMFGVL
ncbi:hypothetical protein C8Q79DRAFT_1114464 [Trametes meyenii]|nr:hypothetical protein C8Q79DRAFT_1114464 [Trametes meyenii]